MEETFRRPLVIGYLAFDMAIGPDGVLGPPIPTHAVLHERTVPAFPESDTVRLISNARLAEAYRIIEDQAAAGDRRAVMLKAALDKLGSIVPKTYPVPIYAKIPRSKGLEVRIEAGERLRSNPPNLRDLTTYHPQLIGSLKALEQADERAQERRQWLEPTRKAHEKMLCPLKQHRLLLQEANEYAGWF